METAHRRQELRRLLRNDAFLLAIVDALAVHQARCTKTSMLRTQVTTHKGSLSRKHGAKTRPRVAAVCGAIAAILTEHSSDDGTWTA